MVKQKHARVFPKLLYRILEEQQENGDSSSIISWNASGTSFKIHDRQRFMQEVLVQYGLKQSHFKSFVRQLNLWGFQCIHGGRKNADRGSYYHEFFRRNEFHLIDQIQRIKIKGKCIRHHKQQPQQSTVSAPPKGSRRSKRQAAVQATAAIVASNNDNNPEWDMLNAEEPQQEASSSLLSNTSNPTNRPTSRHKQEFSQTFVDYLDSMQWNFEEETEDQDFEDEEAASEPTEETATPLPRPYLLDHVRYYPQEQDQQQQQQATSVVHI